MCLCALVAVMCAGFALLGSTYAADSGRVEQCLRQCEQRIPPPNPLECEVSCTKQTRSPGPCKDRSRRGLRLREAAVIARSSGLDVDMGRPDGHSNEVLESLESWSLHLESLSVGEEAVAARVSWRPPRPCQVLLSWEVEGGVLRGNILTNSTSASLTLWPHTRYHVQVSSAQWGTSDCLAVDTGTGLVASSTLTMPLAPENVAAGSAALALLAMVILLARRWRRSGFKEADHNRHCDSYKVYPPAVTLQATNSV